MSDTRNLTRSDNYFEDFEVGQVMRHARGKTLEALENILITNLTMNTADGHFDEQKMAGSRFKQRIVFGGVTAALVIGLTSEDTSENAVAELEIDKLRLSSPVFHGDTIYAYSEVLSTEPGDREDCGVVTFAHAGVNDKGMRVFECERKVLVKRRSHWLKQ